MDHSELTDRIRALGEAPVPDDARRHHLHRLATAGTRREKRFGRLAVAGAAVVGFFAGSTGLAMAGALPAPAQDVAHDVLSVVQVDVPEGNRGSCVSAIANDETLTAEQKNERKRAECGVGGPPPWAGRGGEEGPGGGPPAHADRHADDPCRGKPPWAGKPGGTPEERAARAAEREQWRQTREDPGVCPPDAGEAEDPAAAQQEAAEDAAEAEREAAEDAAEAEQEAADDETGSTGGDEGGPPETPGPPAETPPVDTGGETDGQVEEDPAAG